MILSGILLTPTGVPYKNSSVRITANNTSEQVLMFVQKDFKTDADGAYEIDVPNGWYHVSVYSFEYRGYTNIGNIEITDETTQTTLNELLMLDQTAHSDGLAQQVAADAASALASKNAAALSATNAANSATASATSATSSQTSATNSQTSATSSASSASSATISATTATTKASEAATSAQDALNSANDAEASAVYTESLLSTKVSITDLAADGAALNVGSSVVTVFSIADLLAAPRKSGITYDVTSYFDGWAIASPYRGPRGGGSFVWKSTSVTPDDGGYVLQVPGVVTGRFHRIKTGQVFAEEFGRVADNVVDDTVAIDNGQKYLKNHGGGVLFWQEGLSAVTVATIYSKVVCEGTSVRGCGIRALPVADPGHTYGLVQIDRGIVAECGWRNLTISGGISDSFNIAPVNPTQWGMYLHAQWDVDYTQGGLWHSTFRNLRVINFNKGVWSRGGYTDAHSLLPNQFVKFQDCQVGVRGAVGSIGYMFTGQHGQIELENGYTGGMSTDPDDISDIGVLITYDPNPAEIAVDGPNGHGESTSDLPGVGQASRCATGVISMGGFACEKTRIGYLDKGACSNNSVNETWFESVGICLDVQDSAHKAWSANRHANAGNGTIGAGIGNGSIAGTTMLIADDSAMKGRFAAGMSIAGTGVTAGTKIVTQLTGATGKAGTYQVSISQTVASAFIQGGAGDGGIKREGVGSRSSMGAGGFILGTTDNLVASSSVGLDQVTMWEYLGQNNARTTGMGLFKNDRQHKIVVTDASGVVDGVGHPNYFVSPNADRTIRISTIHGYAMPGQRIVHFAIGSNTYRNNGNISLSAAGVPEITCPSGGTAVFERIVPQLGAAAEWKLVSVTKHFATSPPSDGFYYAAGHVIENNAQSGGASAGWKVITPGVASVTLPTVVFSQLPKVINDYAYFTPLTGTTVQCPSGSSTAADVIIDPAGTLATLTVALPTSPVDGQNVVIPFTQTITTLTLTAVTGTILNAPTTVSGGQTIEYKYIQTPNKWVRKRVS